MTVVPGVNVMAFYSSAVLQNVLGDKNALLGSMGFGESGPAVYLTAYGTGSLIGQPLQAS